MSLLQMIRCAFARKPKWRRLRMQTFTYHQADRLIKTTANLPDAHKWVLAEPEEDHNTELDLVYLEQRVPYE